MIGGTTYVSSCYEKHLNNFSSGLLVCFCVLCCYSTKDRLCRGVYRQSERGRTLHTGKYLIATFQNICQRQCQHSSSRDDYGKLPWKYLTQGRTRARQTICEGFHSANAYGVPTTNMPCSEVSEAANGISTSPAKRLKAETDPKPAKAVLKFAKLSENATVPTRGSAKAAGYDLYSAYDYSIAPLDKTIVKTDIQIAVPPGCYGRVAPRSGLAAKHFIDVGAGVVDEDYRGNVGVVLFNFSKETFEVKKGDRVAQLICEKICYPELEQHDTLDVTARGAGGFGSTGTN